MVSCAGEGVATRIYLFKQYLEFSQSHMLSRWLHVGGIEIHFIIYEYYVWKRGAVVKRGYPPAGVVVQEEGLKPCRIPMELRGQYHG